MSYILALDQGTTSSRAIVFDREGAILGSAQREFEQFFPQSGWVEHDAGEIWESQLAVAKEALLASKIEASDLAAIGITNQRETTVVWERATSKPIAKAIVWQDRRTAGFCDELKAEGLAKTIQEKTGLVIDAYFSGTKLRWLLDNVSGARARAEAGELAFGTIDSWLIWNLTGGKRHVTDVSNASRTMIFDIHKGDWDAELLEMLQIPAAVLPEVCSSSEVYGETAPEILGRAVPVAGIAGDQQAALFGQMCLEPGMVKNTYGTGCFILMNTGTQAASSRNQLLTTVAWRIGSQTVYALEGSVFIAGAVVQWLRDGLKIIRDSGDVEELAASVPDNGGVYLVPAFTGLGAPHWDPYARGTIIGLTRDSSAAHIARAALESIAYQVADAVTAMQDDAGFSLTELRVDGGASVNDLLMQFQADVLGVPVVRSQMAEATALGAAYLAGLAVGYWEDLPAIASQWKAQRVFEPQIPESERQDLREQWTRAVERSKGWARSSEDSTD